jgi:hypothetical protein
MRKFLAIVLAAILGFLGTMALSHVPRNVMVYQDRQIERGANMTSFELNESDVLEVDGIQFRTLLPEEVVYLPKHGEETSIQFGVQITNQTSVPYRFNLQRFLPEILNSDGEIMPAPLSQNGFKKAQDSDIPLLSYKESIDFLMDAKFKWYKGNYLQLLGDANYGGTWIVWNLKAGEYKVRFAYENSVATKKMITVNEGRTEIDGFWIGNIKTPLTPLRLRQRLLH